MHRQGGSNKIFKFTFKDDKIAWSWLNKIKSQKKKKKERKGKAKKLKLTKKFKKGRKKKNKKNGKERKRKTTFARNVCKLKKY